MSLLYGQRMSTKYILKKTLEKIKSTENINSSNNDS